MTRKFVDSTTSILDHSLCHCCMSLFCSSAVIDCGEPKPLLNGGVTFLSGFQNQYRSVVQYHCNEPFYALFGGMNGEIFIYSVLRCTVLDSDS